MKKFLLFAGKFRKITKKSIDKTNTFVYNDIMADCSCNSPVIFRQRSRNEKRKQEISKSPYYNVTFYGHTFAYAHADLQRERQEQYLYLHRCRYYGTRTARKAEGGRSDSDRRDFPRRVPLRALSRPLPGSREELHRACRKRLLRQHLYLRFKQRCIFFGRL